MIEVKFIVKRGANGKIEMSAQALGVGDEQCAQLGTLIYQGGTYAYDEYIKSIGGTPQLIQTAKTLTKLGNG